MSNEAPVQGEPGTAAAPPAPDAGKRPAMVGERRARGQRRHCRVRRRNRKPAQGGELAGAGRPHSSRRSPHRHSGQKRGHHA
ncbi:hypothetical protein [Aliiglaciecola aliphaticivorans]